MNKPDHKFFAATLALILLVMGSLWLGASERIRFILGNTLLLATGVAGLSALIGAVLAIQLTKTELPGRRSLAMLLGITLLIPIYLQAAAWIAGFGLQGWFTLENYDNAAGEYSLVLLQGWRGAIWIQAVAAVPWVVAIIALGLQTMPAELEEAALLDASRSTVMLRVTLRQAIVPLLIAMLWVGTTTASDMTVSDLFQIRTFAEEVYDPLKYGETYPNLLASTLLTSLLLMFAFLVCRHLAWQLAAADMRPTWKFPLKGFRWAAGLLSAAFVFLICFVPLGNLFYMAGMQVEQTETGRIRQWSLRSCLQTIAESPVAHQREIMWSLLIGFVAACAATGIAALLAWLAVRYKRVGAPISFAVAATALALPGPILGLAIIKLLNQPEVPPLTYLYDQTIVPPLLAQSIKAIPLATFVLWFSFTSIPEDLLRSAASEGAGGLAQFWHIGIKGQKHAVAAAWLAGLIIALGELGATILVLPPGMTTLTVRIFNLIHYGVDNTVAGICIALILVLGLFALLFQSALFLLYRANQRD